MKLIFIYDSAELQDIRQVFQNVDRNQQVHVLTMEDGKKKHLYDIAIDIKKELKEQEDAIIFINQFLDCADEDFEWLQRNAGIALIKFLRMMEVKQHIVLISPFVEIELIRENPTNLIVTSKGVSLKRHLHELRDMSVEEVKNKFSETFKHQGLKPYILAEFRLPEDERHNWANWWGIIQLIDVHRALFPIEINFTELKHENPKYPSNLERQIKTLRSQQALWLYRHKVDFNLAVDKEDKERIKKKIRVLDSEIDRLKKRIEGTGKKAPKPNDWCDFINDRESIKRENQNNPKWRREILPTIDQQIEEAKNGKKAGESELKEKLNKKNKYKDALKQLKSGNLKIEDGCKDVIQKYRFKGSDFQPRILYIDDKAGAGWAYIFQLMIYGETKSDFFNTIVPSEGSSVDDVYSKVKRELNSLNPHLILLDLRLQNEGGPQLEVYELSGARILQMIRDEFPGIPVMMTTASNKSLTLEQLQSIGCDAFWTKEGIDQKMSETDSVKNYTRFIELVKTLTDKRYKFLKKVANKIAELKSIERNWWEDPNWLNVEKDAYHKDLVVEKHVVYDILDDSLLIIRDYLRLEVQQSVYGISLNKWLYPTLIIQNMAKIIEHIHGVSQTGIPSTSFIRNRRGDQDAAELLKIRGHASHYNDAQKVSFETAKQFSNDLIKYLIEKPVFSTGPKVVGKNNLNKYGKR